MTLGYLGDFMKKPTIKCKRCGLKSPEDNGCCSYCDHLKTEAELQSLKEEIKSNSIYSNKIGLVFIFLVFVISLLLYLSA